MRLMILFFSFANFYCNTHAPGTVVSKRDDSISIDKKITMPKDTIEIKSNSEFSIQLRASLGTGNRWMLEDSLDKNSVLLIRSETITDSTEMAAKPDLQNFVFKALKQGTVTISFIYKRPWRKNDEPNAERKKYFIKIV